MAYHGYLLKVNGAQVPGKYITEYESTPNRQSDLDPWTDGTGKTHRNVLPHERTVIKFTTPLLRLEDKILLKSLFPNRQEVQFEYWNDDTNDYDTGTFYVPDVTYPILDADSETIIYRPISFEFIEY